MIVPGIIMSAIKNVLGFKNDYQNKYSKLSIKFQGGIDGIMNGEITVHGYSAYISRHKFHYG
jgi:hypothetical protein